MRVRGLHGTQPSDRGRRRRRALRDQCRRFLSGGRRAAPRRLDPRGGTARADDAARPSRCASRVTPKRRCATGCRSICTSARQTPSVAPQCSGRGKLLRARAVSSSSISSTRSVHCAATAAVLRDHAARHTLAGGRVVDPFAPRRGRRQPARLAVLEALAATDPAQALAALLAVKGVVDLAQFALARNLAPERARSADRSGQVSACRPGARFGCGDRGAVGCGYATRLSTALGTWHRAQPDALGPSRPALIVQLRGRRPRPRSTRRSPLLPRPAAPCARARYGACPSTSLG